MEKINKNLKIKILAITLLTNICVYLLTSENTIEAKPLTQSVELEGHINIRVKAELFTNYETYKPVVITNKDRSLIIPYSVLMNLEDGEELTHLNSPKTNYITLSINKVYAQELLAAKNIHIIPYMTGLKKKKQRRQYEINY